MISLLLKKKYSLCFLIMLLLSITPTSNAQITGIYTIPGSTYPTIKSAFTAINISGIGSGGVTFNVTAGYTENFLLPSDGVITTTGTSANKIVFRKSGSGANPVITAGVGIGNLDAIIILAGVQYISFDGIDLQENAANINFVTQMEWGFALLKKNRTAPFVGCQHVEIKNCSVTLNKSNIASEGIHINNHTPSSITSLTITNTEDANSYITLDNITVQNSFSGIVLNGFADVSQYSLYDQENQVINCTVQNYGGAAAITEAYGIKGIYQNDFVVNSNTINNTANSGVSHGTTLYGILNSTGNNSNFTARYNLISLTKGVNKSNLYGISNLSTGNIVISNNTLSNFGIEGYAGYLYLIYNSGTNISVSIDSNSIGNTSALHMTAGDMYFIYNASNSPVINIRNNTIDNIHTNMASGNIYGYYNGFSNSGGTELFTNNTISNISVVSFAGMIYAYSSEAGYNIKECSNNIIFNINGGAGLGFIYGISTNSGNTTNIFNNNIYNLISYYGSICGVSIGNRPITTNIYSNNIYDFSANSHIGIDGIQVNGGTTTSIYKNNIYDLVSTYDYIYGISIISGKTINIYNNFVSGLNTTDAYADNAISGLYFKGGTNVNAYFNTVLLKAVSSNSGLFGTSGIYATSVPVLDLRNNIVVNASVPIGTGLIVAYRRDNTSLSNYANISNNNDLYAGTPGSNNLIFYDGTNKDQSMAAYKSRVSPKDSGSVSENAPFVNSTTLPFNLHLLPTITSKIINGGIPVTTPFVILTDIDNDSRDSLKPCIGADEVSTNDHFPPTIACSPLANTGSTSARVLTATITDVSGLPVSGIGLPRLFWSKNGGSFTPVTSVYTGSDKFTFTFGEGVAETDSIRYYIVAQDNAVVPNVACYPLIGSDNFTSNPPNAGVPPTNPCLYKIYSALSGTFNIPGYYATLTEAAIDINSRSITGNVILVLGPTYRSTAETFPIIFNENAGSSADHLLTIKPAAVGINITGNSATSLIKFNGIDYVVLDGSYNGTFSRDLTISNIFAGCVAVLHVASIGTGAGATNITIKNCNFLNQPYTYSGSDIYLDGDDNDNITIQNNFISKCYIGIEAHSSINGQMNNLQIIGNSIGGRRSTEFIYSSGISLSGTESTVISQNEISNIPGYGIYISDSVSNANISRNKIYDILDNSVYSPSSAKIGISLNGSNNKIVNNVIYGIKANNGAVSTYGIRISGGTNNKIYYNSVFMSDAASVFACLNVTRNTVTGLDIRNNIFANSLTGSTGTISYSVYAAAGTIFEKIDHNDYYFSGSNSVLGYLGDNKSTLSSWQSATMQDINSKAADPLFIGETDLRINPGSPVLTAGTSIEGITVDFAGITRNSLVPSIGAYEFANSPQSGPYISYTPLTDSMFSKNINLNNVLITDPDGVASGSLKPRVYWSVDLVNWYSSAAVNDVSPYNFVIGPDGLNPYVIFKYFVIAQDLLGYVSAVPGAGLKATDVNHLTSPPTNPYSKQLTSVESTPSAGPSTFALEQNYPNPFNPSTKIKYQIPKTANVNIVLYSITGERITELVNREQAAGYYTLEVNSIGKLATSVYIYRMIAIDKVNGKSFINVKKMILLK